jgi:glucose-6-phosphate isomerase
MDLLYKNTALITEDEIAEVGKTLQPYIEYLQKVASANDYSYPESSINLPFDEHQLKSIRVITEHFNAGGIKCLVVIGIGGSGLGSRAFYDAFKDRVTTEVVFLDTVVEPLPDLSKYGKEDILINVISKSGTTYETNINLNKLLNTYPHFKERVVYTTGLERDDVFLSIPEKVGGRFSTLSPVGLFPLTAMGLDIVSLLEGAMEARKFCLNNDVFDNYAALSAIVTFLNYQKGRSIKVNFIFHPQLESLGKWYRQMVAESLGKEGKGITPIVSIGTNDLHSMLQLYLAGPDDKFTEFISAEKNLPTELIPISEGVKKSYQKNNRPYAEISLGEISERSIGHYMQYKMIEVMYLGKLFGVNTFDQPAVEDYKKEARKTA